MTGMDKIRPTTLKHQDLEQGDIVVVYIGQC